MRYIGSKARILDFIDDVITDVCGDVSDMVFADLFSGTASVASHYKRKGSLIISNDYLHFSYALQVAKVKLNRLPKCKFQYNDALSYLNSLTGAEGFFTQQYTLEGTRTNQYQRNYFSYDNARKIDAICMQLRKWLAYSDIDEDMFFLLTASLIDGITKVSNTSGTYGAFLKIDDKRKYKELSLEEIKIFSNEKENQCFCKNIEDIIDFVEGDVLYLDPPYNSRQYPPYYHILETAVLYDNPDIYGVTGRRHYENKLSTFCMKDRAQESMMDIISRAKFKHIFISYSTDGIIEYKSLMDKAKQLGKVDCFHREYRRYKSNGGGEKHAPLKEIIIYVEKR